MVSGGKVWRRVRFAGAVGAVVMIVIRWVFHVSCDIPYGHPVLPS